MPLEIHARYSRLEILAAFGVRDTAEGAVAKMPPWQTGVYWAKAAKAEGVRESPRLAAAKAAAEAIPEAALEDVDEEAEEAATDGFKVHKYAPPAAPEDETLQCRDCGGDFIFTVGEQEFFKSKGFENKKTRCADCTAAKKSRFGEEGGGGGKGKGKGGGKGKGKGKGDGGGSGGGVCYAFQKGECTRGAGCRFSH